MKKFVIKDTIINLKTLEAQVWFTGKSHQSKKDIRFVEGYVTKQRAILAISNEMEGYQKVNDNHCIESNNVGTEWLHHYEIVEVDQL